MNIDYNILSINEQSEYRIIQENLSFILVISGTGTISSSNGVIFNIQPSDLIRLSPNEQYIFYAHNRIFIAIMKISDYYSTQNEFTRLSSVENEYVKKALFLALELQNINTPNKNEIINSISGLIWNIILGLGIKNTVLNPMVEKVMKTIREHHTDCEFNLSQEINRSGYTPGHFRRLFKEQVGIPPLEFLVNVRMDTAKKYMRESTNKLTVKDIAFHCGYSDTSFFSRQFKKKEGQTPMEYFNQLHTKIDRKA